MYPQQFKFKPNEKLIFRNLWKLWLCCLYSCIACKDKYIFKFYRFNFSLTLSYQCTLQCLIVGDRRCIIREGVVIISWNSWIQQCFKITPLQKGFLIRCTRWQFFPKKHNVLFRPNTYVNFVFNYRKIVWNDLSL